MRDRPSEVICALLWLLFVGMAVWTFFWTPMWAAAAISLFSAATCTYIVVSGYRTRKRIMERRFR